MFRETASRQRQGELLFSACADLMSLVVASMRKSVNAAYRARKEDIGVAVKSVYKKLAGIEAAVSERMVRDTAADLADVVGELKAEVAGPVPGYSVRILDGNHLAGTDHRIKELRTLGAAALPGSTIAILNPQRQLIEDVVICDDGHACERSLFPAVLDRVQRGQCWIGDSSFCTLAFLFGLKQRRAYFIIRQHGSLHGTLLGRRRKLGRSDTGVVYEQKMRVVQGGREMELRRITIVRDQPTEKGKTEVHLLTNLPAKVTGKKVAQAYRQRWKIETAFQDLATVLRSEVNTLGYPDAALFGFCVGLVLYNVLSTIKAALRSTAGEKKKRKRNLSSYYLADEISGVWRGMEIAIPTEHWTATFAELTPKQLTRKLRYLAKKTDLPQFYTNPWTPKRPPPKKISGNRGNHVSTKKILEQRKRGAA